LGEADTLLNEGVHLRFIVLVDLPQVGVHRAVHLVSNEEVPGSLIIAVGFVHGFKLIRKRAVLEHKRRALGLSGCKSNQRIKVVEGVGKPRQQVELGEGELALL